MIRKGNDFDLCGTTAVAIRLWGNLPKSKNTTGRVQSTVHICPGFQLTLLRRAALLDGPIHPASCFTQ